MEIKTTGDTIQLEKEVQKIIQTAKEGPVIVDMVGVSFLLSSSIAQVVKLYKHAKRKKWDFEVVNVGEDLYGMLEILKLTQVMKISKQGKR